MNKLVKFLPHILVSLAVIVMAASLGYQGFIFSQDIKLANTPITVKQKNTEPQSQKVSINRQTLLLFGDPNQNNQPVVQQQKEIPKTNLRLTLRGVTAASGEYEGSALIEGSNKETEQYKVGDNIEGNAKLHAVYSDRVVLTRAGIQESLYFPKVSTGGGIEYYPEETSDPDPSPPVAQNTLPTRSTPNKSPAGSISESRKEEIRRKLEELRNRMKVN